MGSSVEKLRNLLIAIAVVILSIGLFLGNQVRTHSISLETLASQSVDFDQARTNDKPTLIEFYADWCTTCRSMAPLMADLEQEFADQINFVLLNVDNPKWLPELNQYKVNGIPHFEWINSQNQSVGSAIGEQPRSILRSNLIALQQGQALTTHLSGRVSPFSAPATPERNQPQPDPRSHG
jgi:thiol-disulfide isomerase/thioredoxin